MLLRLQRKCEFFLLFNLPISYVRGLCLKALFSYKSVLCIPHKNCNHFNSHTTQHLYRCGDLTLMSTLWLSVGLSGGRVCAHIGILLSSSIGVPNHFLSASGKVTSTDSLNRKTNTMSKQLINTSAQEFSFCVCVSDCVYLGCDWLRLESSFEVSEFPCMRELSVSMAVTSESLTAPGPALGSMMPVNSRGEEDWAQGAWGSVQGLGLSPELLHSKDLQVGLSGLSISTSALVCWDKLRSSFAFSIDTFAALLGLASVELDTGGISSLVDFISMTELSLTLLYGDICPHFTCVLELVLPGVSSNFWSPESFWLRDTSKRLSFSFAGDASVSLQNVFWWSLLTSSTLTSLQILLRKETSQKGAG